jgi:hypothetical protein
LLVKLPVPVPLFVLVVKAIVGFCVVLQTTPLAVIVPPPSLLILPPLLAVVEVMEETVVVVRVARLAGHGPQVGTPLQKVSVWPVLPGVIVIQDVPFQYIIWPWAVPLL